MPTFQKPENEQNKGENIMNRNLLQTQTIQRV